MKLFSKLCYALTKEEYGKVELLGRGSFSEMWLVKHRPTSTNYAMKLIFDEEKVNESEINTLKSLQHPHIVAYIGIKMIKDQKCVLMEFSSGGDLGSYLKAEKEQGKELAEEQNIFLVEKTIKVGDFGLLRLIETNVSKVTNSRGAESFAYKAPELLNDWPRFGPKSDVWALGCIVFEMCALEKLFKTFSDHANIRKEHEYQPPRIPLQYSDYLWGLVKHMLSKGCIDRPNCMEIADKVKYDPVVFMETYLKTTR